MTNVLPIDAVLPDLLKTLRAAGRAVLQAPPGAGKTTRVPLALMQDGAVNGRILMLEPRRLAARAAAERMAQTLGESVGLRVGYRIRGDAMVSDQTCIEVVTEGILTRMIQSDPELSGIGAVIFDEFHERSLNADLGLALCLEVADALRDDLMLIAMSATLDAGPVAEMMKAPLVTSEGRSFDVTSVWLEKPLANDARFEHAMADLVCHALSQTEGSALVFLPGEGEIRRVEAVLQGQLPRDCTLAPLFGAMPFKDQRRAIQPARTGRKVVLATSIAETSLTIEDIRIVVDGGRARRAQFDPSSGMSRLITERVSRAEATQRAGRAGRVAPGVAYKLWTKGQDGALPEFPPAEVEVGDLAGLALELAQWGATAEELAFVTPPHAGRLAEAQDVLRMLGALDGHGKITDHGKKLARVPLHPRLAHMVRKGGQDAPRVAALLAERDPMRGAGVDLALRMKALNGDSSAQVNAAVLAKIRQEAKRLARFTKGSERHNLGALCALAYPDRVGLRRNGDAPRFVMSGGKGAVMPDGDPIGGYRLIVATNLDGNPREAKIRQAAALTEADLRALFSDQIHWQTQCVWSRRDGRVATRRQEVFGALVLEDQLWREAPPDQVALAMLDGVRHLGLWPDKKALRFLSRVRLLDGLPDFGEEALIKTAEDWLLPHLTNVRSTADWKEFDLLPALQARLDWDQTQRLNKEAPSHFETPLGRRIAIDYESGTPGISVRLQEMFGVTQHPVVAGKPLQVTLLSPASRPVQVTGDIPGFWASSYADVRKDMRGRYPRHPWPEDPTKADPTLRAKPRGT